MAAEYTQEITDALEPFVYELVGEYRPFPPKHIHSLNDTSFVQGVSIRGAWHRCNEDTCSEIQQGYDKHCANEENQGLVRSQGYYEPLQSFTLNR